MKYILVYCLQVPGRKYLVSFLGKTGKLATAQVHGNSIDIWPPASDTQCNVNIVMNQVDGISVAGKILR